MSGKGESPTSPRRLSVAGRRRRAVELRKTGLNFYQIADAPEDPKNPNGPVMYQGDNGHKRAQEDVAAALREIRKDTDGDARDLRTLELLRLDALQVSLTPATLPRRPVSCPDPGDLGCRGVLWREVDNTAVQNVLRISERRSKFLGLDASDVNDGRMVDLLEEQVAMAHGALVEGMVRAGVPAETQREVLEHVADVLREQEAHGRDDEE